MNKTKILVVGQTPPPFHGQAVMIQEMLGGDYGDLELRHVRMGFSGDVEEVGKFRLGKLWELMRVIAQILAGRFVHQARILYYPPAGPHSVPVLRDLAILVSTRWAFEKTVFHFHAGGLTDLYPRLFLPLRWLFKIAYVKPDLAIRISERAPEDGKKLRARQECIVPNGVEDEYDARRRKPDAGGPAHVLFVGILCEEKGVLDLLEACRILREKQVPFRIDLMGGFESGQFEQSARACVQSSGLAEAVTFLGPLTGSGKRAAFEEADILCLPSHRETFGLVLVEAMSFSLPVVSTRCGAPSDIVEDGMSGFLVPIGDAAAVAEKLELLIRDPALRIGMGEQGRKRYLERFTVEQFRQRMRQALELVVAG